HLNPEANEQKHADMFWIPLISLYTGARMNEICQLEVADVTEEKGIPCFQITTEGEDDNKKLKNIGSKRKVPIHKNLIAIGLMEYVAFIRSKGHLRLFYDLKTGGT